MRFGHGRRVKNSKKSISATAETEKTTKTAFSLSGSSKIDV